MPNIEIENLIKSFSESVKLVQKVKAQMDEIQDQISPEIKKGQSRSLELLNEIGKSAEDVFKKLDEREELLAEHEEKWNEKCKDAFEKIDQKMSEIGNVRVPPPEGPKLVVTPKPIVTTEPDVGKVEGCTYRIVEGGRKVEVRFAQIPSTKVREILKKHKFGWSGAKAAWTGNADKHPENVELAKKLAGKN